VAIGSMDIVIDVNAAQETSNIYVSSIKEIDVIMTNLKNCVKDLSSNWKGDASNSFTTNHFPKLYESMQKHVDMITNLQQEIALAVKDFNDLDTDLKNKF